MNKIIIAVSLAFATLFIIADTPQRKCKKKAPKVAESAQHSTSVYTATYPFSLPLLPYGYDALEPYIDKKTMEIHHNKHHQAYVDNLNNALKDEKALHGKTLFELLDKPEALPEKTRTAIINQGGGHFNHSLFWTMMAPGKAKMPSGKLAAEITKTFGSFAKFKEEFTAKAKTAFGSGWSWLVTDPQGNLSVITTHDQGAPISGHLRPILGLDVWEHAYYLKYQNRRPDYISAWWHVINWPEVEKMYAIAIE